MEAEPEAPSIRDRILGAARGLFLKKGFNGSNLRDIAREAGGTGRTIVKESRHRLAGENGADMDPAFLRLRFDARKGAPLICGVEAVRTER